MSGGLRDTRLGTALNDWGAFLGARERLMSRVIFGVVSLVAAGIAWFSYPEDIETAKAEAIAAVLCAVWALRPGWKRTMT
jgi:hypothetical protein